MIFGLVFLTTLPIHTDVQSLAIDVGPAKAMEMMNMIAALAADLAHKFNAVRVGKQMGVCF